MPGSVCNQLSGRSTSLGTKFESAPYISNQTECKQVIHYIAVEATFALPKRPDWQIVYRLHHRSGVFGLFGAENAGNTAVQIGVRHYFK